MFKKARIKLTLWYLIVIMAITGSISALFYVRTVNVLDLELARIQQRIARENVLFFPVPGNRPPAPQVVAEEYAEAKERILIQLLIINAAIFVGVGLGGYFLSGFTLKPIQKALEEQKRFVSDAAHELRTPITALKTSLEVNLMDKTIPKETRRILKENLEDLGSLESLSEGLLKLSKRDQNGIFLTNVSVLGFIKDAVKLVEPLAKKKDIKIKINKFPKSYTVKGDENLLKEVVVILLDNAVKYSNKNTQVEISVFRHSKNINLEVKDHGIGIENKHLSKIFDRFYRADEARTTQNENGHGLGLSIAKKIVESHKGNVSVKSEIGKGTTFSIILQSA